MTTSRYRVPAMDCAAEEQLVRMALSAIDGVERVRVDLDDRKVAVRHATDRAGIDAAMSSLRLGATHVADVEDADDDPEPEDEAAERPALLLALAFNLLGFFGEVGFGLVSGSMGVVADGLDMGADAAVYALGLAAMGTAAVRKRQLARRSGWLQAVLATIGLAETVRRLVVGADGPDVAVMAVVALLALVGNVVVLVVLRRVRTGEAHIEASWIFTANDVIANLLVLVAAGLVAWTGSAIPDRVAGFVIFAVVANGARRILSMSR